MIAQAFNIYARSNLDYFSDCLKSYRSENLMPFPVKDKNFYTAFLQHILIITRSTIAVYPDIECVVICYHN
jgi:hypothetical protein